jgi:hypothetical protein
MPPDLEWPHGMVPSLRWPVDQNCSTAADRKRDGDRVITTHRETLRRWVGGSERTIDLPPSVRMDMIAFIELHLVLATRFAVERIDGGFRVRLAR